MLSDQHVEVLREILKVHCTLPSLVQLALSALKSIAAKGGERGKAAVVTALADVVDVMVK